MGEARITTSSSPELRNGGAPFHPCNPRCNTLPIPKATGPGCIPLEGSHPARPQSLGTRVAWGKPKPCSPGSQMKLSTFPAASTRWTSEREEVPGRGTSPIPSHPIPSCPIPSRPACSHHAIRRRLRVRPGEPQHGTASRALPTGPAGAGAGDGGLTLLLGPPGPAPSLHACLRERCLRPGRPGHQHVRFTP